MLDIPRIKRRAAKLEMENKELEREYNEAVAKLHLAEKAKKAKLVRKVQVLEETNKEWKQKIEALKKEFDTDDDSG